jgi:hypothetical protein
MGTNALFERGAGSLGLSRRVFMSEFSIGDVIKFQKTLQSIYRFLMAPVQSSTLVPFWNCLSVADVVQYTVNRTFISAAPKNSSQEDERKHITTGLMNESMKSNYEERLQNDIVLGPLIDVISDALLA